MPVPSFLNETNANMAEEIAQTNELLEKELAQARQDLCKSNEQKAGAEQAAEALRETNERLEQELERMQRELYEVKEQKASTEQTMDGLRETNERLQKELECAQQDFRKEKDDSAGPDQSMDELKETNERLDKELERVQLELRTVKEQKRITEQAAEELDTEARQLHEENEALKHQLFAEKAKQGLAAANKEDLQERLDQAQAQIIELSQRTVELEQELRRRPEVVKSPSLLEDSSVPQLQAEVNALTAKKDELESQLKGTIDQLREALSAQEDLQRRYDEMRDDLDQVTDAVSHERNEAKHYKARVTELEIRISELETPAMQSSAKSLFAEVYDSRKQLELDVKRLFYEKLNLQQKLNNAMRMVRLSALAHQPHAPELDGATLEAFKKSEQSISDYRQQVRSLQDKVDHLEKENSQLRAPATPRQRIAIGIRETFEREKKELVTRIRNLEAEIETQKKALLEQLDRNASVPHLEAEVKRLNELSELIRYESRSPEDKAKLTDPVEWLKRSGEKEAAKKTQEEAKNQPAEEPEVPFEVRIRQKYEARKREQEEGASTSSVIAKPAVRKPPVKVKVKQPTAYAANPKK
ncbi:hypothetical protein AAVH_11717 [Aphelenchoides avenae]|nr:hypothetical protein AAVH_11717 [Aphelenchus avenae]